MIKTDIFSGFLGAGKTTLIKKLADEAYKGEKLVIVENEFGEIGIDKGFLEDSGIEITEMNSGCICCTLVGDFTQALKKVAQELKPDRIIIEPSGVGKLSDVKEAAEQVEEIDIAAGVTVVDAKKCRMYMKNFGEFFNNQIESANTIILSRTQNVSQDKIEKAVSMIREHNQEATIVTTPWDDISGAMIREAMQNHKTLEESMMEEEHDHDHHHDHDECGCHDHHHDHDDECECHEHDHHDHDHHHDHDECGCHDHDHHDHDHGDGCTCGCHDHDHHHHHADEVFTSWGKETPHKYNETKLNEILDTLADTEKYGIILRAKGILPSDAGDWLYFDLVPGEYEIRKGNPDITGKLCVIGSKLDEAALAELFELV